MRFGFAVLVGLLVLLAGISILLRAIFHIDLPLIRVGAGVFFVYLGVRLIAGMWGVPRLAPRGDNAVIFSDSLFVPEEIPSTGFLKYDVVFGQGIVDLTRLPKIDRDVSVEVNSIFSSVVVKMDPAVAYDVEGGAVFGEARMPDRTMAAFGNTHYRTPGRASMLHLKATAVFGSARIVDATAEAPAATPSPQAVR